MSSGSDSSLTNVPGTLTALGDDDWKVPTVNRVLRCIEAKQELYEAEPLLGKSRSFATLGLYFSEFMGGGETSENWKILFDENFYNEIYEAPDNVDNLVALCILLRLLALDSLKLPVTESNSLGVRVQKLLSRMLRKEAVSLKDYFEGVCLGELGPELWVVAEFFLTKFKPTTGAVGQAVGVTFGTLSFATRRIFPLVHVTIAAIKMLTTYNSSMYTVNFKAGYLAKVAALEAPRKSVKRAAVDPYAAPMRDI